MAICIQLAKNSDIEDVYLLIEERCNWFESNGIKQWELGVYNQIYNIEYFEKQVALNNLYVAKQDSNIVGAVVLNWADSNTWKDDGKALYIHNLVTSLASKGIGLKIINFAINFAIDYKTKYLRLECIISNEKLNNYYEKLGFEKVGTGNIYDYHYNMLQKDLNRCYNS